MARRDRKARRHPKARPRGILDLAAQGFGFVKTAEGEFFIPARKTAGAFPGDLVEIAPLGSHHAGSQPAGASRKPAARVVRVLMRANESIVGRYDVAEPFGVVIPENPAIHHDIFTLRSDAPYVHDGDMVEVRIREFPSKNSAATGQVVRVLGSSDDIDVLLELIIAEHKLETVFSPGALAEASKATIDVEEALVQGYRDLRDRFIFTIDPTDARDFDDALSLEHKEEMLCVGVHIADVSQYVPYESSLDLDARKRATSVYLVDRVLPMLPERLSNELCSLAPGVDRLAMSVDIVLDASGKVHSYEIFPSVIRSSARLSYEQAQILIDGASEGQAASGDLRRAFAACEQPSGSLVLDSASFQEVFQRVRDLDKLALRLHAKRHDAGCLDFDRTEAKVRLDAEKRPVEIVYRRRTRATSLVEEAMILANHLVAKWLAEHGMPCVYRSHEEPDPDALRTLYEILQEYPLFCDIDKRLFIAGNPKTLQEVLARVSGIPQAELVNSLMLRAMRRAVYRCDRSEHYALALPQYCHFTSPIRRYPDLLVHRMLKEVLIARTPNYEAQKNELDWMAEFSSEKEREAEAAARRSQLVKIVEYMGAFVGQEFSGTICNVSTFGISVRLECSAKGTLSTECLGDEYFSYDAIRQSLRGTSSGRVFRLGASLKVVLVGVDPRRRCLELRLAD